MPNSTCSGQTHKPRASCMPSGRPIVCTLPGGDMLDGFETAGKYVILHGHPTFAEIRPTRRMSEGVFGVPNSMGSGQTHKPRASCMPSARPTVCTLPGANISGSFGTAGQYTVCSLQRKTADSAVFRRFSRVPPCQQQIAVSALRVGPGALVECETCSNEDSGAGTTMFGSEFFTRFTPCGVHTFANAVYVRGGDTGEKKKRLASCRRRSVSRQWQLPGLVAR